MDGIRSRLCGVSRSFAVASRQESMNKRNHIYSLVWLIFAIWLFPSGAGAQTAAGTSDTTAWLELTKRLPADWLPTVERYRELNFAAEWFLKRVPDTKDNDKLRGEVLQQLSRVPGAESFVLAHTFDGSVPKERVL